MSWLSHGYWHGYWDGTLFPWPDHGTRGYDAKEFAEYVAKNEDGAYKWDLDSLVVISDRECIFLSTLNGVFHFKRVDE